MAEIHEKMAQKTKQEIKKAFLELVEEIGFSNVSVKKIAEQAGINRGTFYLHFVDKFDVMEQIQEELLKDLHARIELIAPKDVFKAIHEGQHYPPLLAIYQFVHDYAHELRVLLGDQGDPSFARKIKQIFGNTLIAQLTEVSYEGNDEEFRNYLFAFLTSAILGIIQEWLNDYEGKTVEDMAKIHYKLLGFIGNLSHLLRNQK
ncbi:TetR/AcrR family transcriptional regulator [Lysinibacillus yapensis]|uniref:TetR/AcrR family transcriptional regulator n=1 Tax=Ureibacillus yapensis TaxID=2304605 RepID=A0A396S3D6_9BACL|nr:TetR/AcrR family transcriptional regulator [Lysinibacillus yapensis]RHW32743.1 TetR/AcrR family transcriptional regulator [Lysinibacillus yapensis]